MSDRCEIRRCRGGVDLVYLGRGVCEFHWSQLTAEDAPPDAMRMGLGIGVDVATALEDTMAAKKKTPKKAASKRAPAKKAAAKRAPAKPAEATKLTTRKANGKTETLCTFAIRMAEAERTKLHRTAGPRGATRFARAVLVAAANEDEAGFRAALKLARESRS